MPSSLLPNLDALRAEYSGLADASVRSEVQTVAFFDLSGSTGLKLLKGEARGLRASRQFCALAAAIVDACEGRVRQYLGDGILATFESPVSGCVAAVNIKSACQSEGLQSSSGLAIGEIDEFEEGTGLLAGAIGGSIVDRAARIQALAGTNQILLEESLYVAVASRLVQYDDLVVGPPQVRTAKGIGKLQIRELSIVRSGLQENVVRPLAIHAAGRMPIADKVAFVADATETVDEIGIGLTSFARYFTGQRPEEFRDHIEMLLARGITVRCFGLDPGAPAGRFFLKEYCEPGYEDDLVRARDSILMERRRLLAKNLPGRLEYFSYSVLPQFHCILVDQDSPLKARGLFSPYLYGSSRSEAPVIELSRPADVELFEKVRRAVAAIRQESTEHD